MRLAVLVVALVMADPEHAPRNGAARRRLRLKQAAAAAEVEAGPAVVLAIEGPSFPSLDFAPPLPQPGAASAIEDVPAHADGTRFKILGTPIYLKPVERSSLSGSEHEVQTSSSVWDCAVVLAKYLEFAQQTQQAHRRPGCIIRPATAIVELGAGTGLAGLAASILLADAQSVADPGGQRGPDGRGGRVVLTDVGAVVGALRETIAMNRDRDGGDGGGGGAYSAGRPPGPPRSTPTASGAVGITATALDWTKLVADLPTLGGSFDLVIAADVVWVERLVEPFVRALEAVTSETGTVLFAYQTRSLRTSEKLFGMLAESFQWDKLDDAEYHPDYSQRIGTIDIFVLTRRSPH